MLEAEKIKSNWDEYRKRVNTLFPDRADKLNKLYDDYEDRMVMMPASSVAHYHNAFAGGYIDHVLRVMDCVEKLYDSWESMGSDMSGYEYNEMMFAAMHHDLGKCGFPGNGREVYQVETSDWHRKNMGRMYKHNENIPFTMVPDLSLYLLQKYNIPLSWNEYQAIKIHDGVYDEANKPYFIARSAQAKLKTNLPLLLHHADHMASQIEYERWRNHKNNTPKIAPQRTKETRKTALKNLAEQNKDLNKSVTDIFQSFNVE